MDVSLGVTALSVLQQPEKLQWEVVASVLEDTVKDLEELGANPSLNQAKAHSHSHSQAKAKDKAPDHHHHHNIPFPCLLAGGLLSYRSPSGTPVVAGPSNAPPPPPRTPPGPPRTHGAEPLFGPLQEQGPIEIESGPAQPPPTGRGFPTPLPGPPPPPAARRTTPVLLLYSVREADDKSPGQAFAQMNSLVGKGLHEEGFTVPQIIEMEFDTHEQLLLQDPPITYIQQFADAAAASTTLDGHADKWSTLAASAAAGPPRPGALVQCVRLPGQLEGQRLYVDSITPCWDGVHLLVVLQPHAAAADQPPSASNQVEALNNINRLHSAALCGHPVANGVEPSPPQTPLILPPQDQQQHRRAPGGRGGGGGGGYLALYKLNYSTRIVTLEEEPVKVQQILDPCEAVTSLILLPPDVLDSREDDSEESPEEARPSASKNCSSGAGSAASGGTAPPRPLHIRRRPQAGGGQRPGPPGGHHAGRLHHGVELLVEQPLATESLMSLVEMTRFETLTPRFSATVPPCWAEVQQEQQQRRHPQHLHQQHHGDAAQHTRTWKLQSDSSSWDEHVFELVLPKACMVGHVDFKFVLNANIVNIPQIQVTLLKNKAPGLGKVSGEDPALCVFVSVSDCLY
ncbi:unnamed protein product [Menidia menidia]|uniref:(Atlantic silverside) hypothetical protein n=1 Tax=Menidia menidia TaxID=238744 RepID=A0A8S4BVN5_9TELE|nr:unnamed protein product [Menidia menidia]